MSRFKEDDPALLLPSFQPIVAAVRAEMTALGYQCVLFDSRRSPKEAAKNAARGVGRPDSIHCYDGAADCICGVHGWSCHEHGCAFFEDYGAIVERHGMVWGGNFDQDRSKPDRVDDRPHMQCVTVAQQPVFRALRDREARDRFVAARLCRLR